MFAHGSTAVAALAAAAALQIGACTARDRSSPPRATTSNATDATGATPSARPAPQSTTTMTLRPNIPTPVGDVRIATGNIWEEPSASRDRPGRSLTAQVWVMDGATGTRQFRVHPGQTFELPGARVRVVSIEKDAVLLAVTTASDASPPDASIGVATMDADGTIVLDLRATGPDGVRGDAQLRYPRDHKDYAAVLKHLGGLRPGESKPVAPWPDPR
jgi:hypothetical protein